MDLNGKNNLDEEREIMKGWKASPLKFIKDIWGLDPQPVKVQYKDLVELLVATGQLREIKVEHFEPFVRGKHITWQQWIIVLAVEQALKFGNNKISVVAGHGIGKDMIVSLLIIWFLMCHYQAQVGATAPTSEQLNDILWKEISIWMGKMPGQLKDLFEWQSGYIRVKEEPEKWFARARTARKEAPEAIAGLHGEHVMLVGDEASGVPNEIYRSAEGSMTGPNVLVILIGNGIRAEGYFYDTHHDDSENWQTFGFSSEESPVVEDGYIERMESKHGRESDEFKVRVSGGFPRAESMDELGWIPLMADADIRIGPEEVRFTGRRVMAVDPSGEGDDTTIWKIRDNFQSRVVAKESTSNEKTIALRTVDLIREYEVDPRDVIIDNFGVGANVSKEILLLDPSMNVTGMNWGEEADDPDLFLNKRAECCFRGRDWLIKGGQLGSEETKKDILGYQYRTTLAGKRQILDKPRLKKKLGRSPDRGDAYFMTFYESTDLKMSGRAGGVVHAATKDDIHSAI